LNGAFERPSPPPGAPSSRYQTTTPTWIVTVAEPVSPPPSAIV
jgi:hypothetical protein